jgi:hypothetical protein
MASEDGGYVSEEGDEDQQDQQKSSPSDQSVFLYNKNKVNVKLSISPEYLNAVILKDPQTSHEYQRVTGFMISEAPTNQYCVTQSPSYKFSIVCKESVHSGPSVTCELWHLTVSRDEAFQCKQQLQTWAVRQNFQFIDDM